MKKDRVYFKTIAIFAMLVMVFNTASIVKAASEKEEIFNQTILLPEKTYNTVKQNFTTVDLRKYTNRSFIDEVEGDGQGGWSDAGSGNDFRDFTFRGMTEFKGVPFDIIEPDDNNNTSCIVLRGKAKAELPVSMEVDVNKTAAGIYFLHCSDTNSGKFQQEATYTLNYDDGTSAYMNILDQEHIFNWWGTAQAAFCQTAWKGIKTQGYYTTISCGIFAMSNPYPEKVIKSITMETVSGGSKAFVMVLGITLTDSGPYLPDLGLTSDDVLNPYLNGWIQPEADAIKDNSALDGTFLLDAPAGKHGAVYAKNEKLFFEDGSAAKFYGTNVIGKAAYLPKEKAELLADGLAKRGYNLVRIKDCDLTALSVNEKDQFDFFVSKLKEKGIYVYLTLSSSKDLSEYVNKDKIEEKKRMINALLTSKNPYTGLSIANDKNVVMAELMDSASIFDLTSGRDEFFLNDDDMKDFQNRFNTFLKNKYHSTKTLKSAWENKVKGYGLGDAEKLEDMSVIYYPSWKKSVLSEERKKDINLFLCSVQKEYYDELNKAIKNTGFKGLVTGNSNNVDNNEYSDAYANSDTEFLARNYIWEKPLGKYGFYYLSISSMLKDKDLGIIGLAAKKRIGNRPYVISEWNSPQYNNYTLEANILMSAFSARQGWTPIQFAAVFDNIDIREEAGAEDFYETYNNTAQKAISIAAAQLYYRTDEMKNTNIYTVNKDDFDGIYKTDTSNFMRKFGLGEYTEPEKYDIKNSAFLNGKMFFNVAASKPKSTSQLQLDSLNDGEVYWDQGKGILSVNNDYVQAIISNKNESIQTDNMCASTDNNFAVITLSSISKDKTIKNADRLLISVGAASRNLRETIRNNAIHIGKAPLLAEPVKAELKIKIDGDYEVYALSQSGERAEAIKAYRTSDGYIVFNTNDTVNKYCSYEIMKVGEI